MTDAQRRAQEAYRRRNHVLNIRINKDTEADIYDWMRYHEGEAATKIKELIRKDITSPSVGRQVGLSKFEKDLDLLRRLGMIESALAEVTASEASIIANTPDPEELDRAEIQLCDRIGIEQSELYE